MEAIAVFVEKFLIRRPPFLAACALFFFAEAFGLLKAACTVADGFGAKTCHCGLHRLEPA
jgi:hypothetical protein